MKKNENLIRDLNDLVEINNDRIRGYEKAIDELKNTDVDLKATFMQMKANSQKHITDLSKAINSLGGSVEDGTTLSGKIYRAWMDVKGALSGHDRESALECCVFGEKAAQKAYEMALKDDDIKMNNQCQAMIAMQKSALLTDLEKIKLLEEVENKD